MGILSFKDFIEITNLSELNENVDIINNRLVISDELDSGIKLSFGKNKKLDPYKKTIEGVSGLVSYSLYQAKTQNSTAILNALKTSDLDSQKINNFLKFSSIYAARVLRKMDVDVIVTPKSSSDLTKKFVKEIQKRTNYDVIIDGFRKQPDISKIEIDVNHPKITPAIIKSMETIIERGIRRDSLSVKMFAVQYRKFVKNLFEVADERIYKLVQNKRVVIIDDIMTSGTTARNIFDILMVNGASDVQSLTLFKS